MKDYREIFDAIVRDARYQANLDWGEPRAGHPEGAVRTHIAELEQHLETLKAKLSETDYWKLKLLIHTHDTFKRESQRGVPIRHPHSHASLAREFLGSYCDDFDLLTMVQFHDEPFALWQQWTAHGGYDPKRFDALLRNIHDWSLFLAFCIIDGCTQGKSREPLQWFFKRVAGKVRSTITAADIH